ncbi:MAG: hypothetical protein AABZ60_16915 [Planctomycetota bacterium]
MTPSPSSLPFSEFKRQIEHIAPISFAFLLETLPYPAVIFLAVVSIFYGLIGSRWLLKSSTMRENERQKKFSWGKFLYGFMVLLLVLVFRHSLYLAGAVWGILAFGDGFSNILGRRFGHQKLPWNSKKSWIGSLSFFISGAFAAFILIGYLNVNVPILTGSHRLQLALIPAFLCALVESLPWKLDDNFTVVFVGAFACAYLNEYPLWND